MIQVLVPIAPGCEEMEAVTLVDVLRRGGLTVLTASPGGYPVTASRGVCLQADAALETVIRATSFDLVVLPGGMGGTRHLMDDRDFVAFLKNVYEAGGRVAAICAAPMVLAKAGLLEGRKFTAYPGVLDASGIHGAEYTGAAVESDGRILTSRGPGTALDFALTLLETVEGKAARDKVERELVR